MTKYNLDRLTAFVMLMVGVSGLIVTMFRGRSFILQGLLLTVPSLSYLWLKKREKPKYPDSRKISGFIPSVVGFTVLLVFGIFRLVFYPFQAPVLGFLFLSGCAILVIMQILFLERDGGTFQLIILLEILIIALLLRWYFSLSYPQVVNSDQAFNWNMTNYTIENAHLPDDPHVKSLPLFYLLVAITEISTSLSPYTLSSMVSAGFFEPFGTVFVFLLGKKLFNSKIGLLAALFLSIAPYHVQWGRTPLSMSMALSFSLLMLPLLLTNIKKTNKVLAIFLGFALILNHSLASFLTLVVLAIAYFGGLIYRKMGRWLEKSDYPTTRQGSLSSIFICLFFLMLISYWIYSCVTSFEQFVKSAYSFFNLYWVIEPWSPEYAMAPAMPGLMELVIDNGRLFLFLAITIIGALYILSKEELNQSKFSYLLFSFTVFAVGYNTIVLIPIGIPYTDMWIPDRWIVFADMFLSIPLALGLFFIKSCFKKRRSQVFAVTLISLLICPLFLTSPMVAVTKRGFSELEIYAAKSVARYLKNGYSVATDMFMSEFFLYVLGVKSEPYEPIIISENQTDIRQQLTGKIIFVTKFSENLGYVYLPKTGEPLSYGAYQAKLNVTFNDIFQNFNRIMDNGEAHVFY